MGLANATCPTAPSVPILKFLATCRCGSLDIERALTIAFDRGQDVVGRLGPAQWGRIGIALAEKQIKRGAHKSVKALIADIMNFVAKRNADPTPLRWTKSADDILASIERFCQRTLDAKAAAAEGG